MNAFRTIRVMCSVEEYETIRRAAEICDQTVEEFVLETAVAAANEVIAMTEVD